MNSEAAATAASILESFYGALFRPRSTFLQPLPMGAAGLVVLGVGLVWAFIGGGGDPDLLPLSLFASLGWIVWSWLGLSISFFLVARVLYDKGDFYDLCAGVGLAFAPLLLAGPAAVLERLGSHGPQLAAAVDVALMVWSLRLVLLAIRGGARLTGAQAVWTLAATELIAVGLPVAWLLLASAAFWLALFRLV